MNGPLNDTSRLSPRSHTWTSSEWDMLWESLGRWVKRAIWLAVAIGFLCLVRAINLSGADI